MLYHKMSDYSLRLIYAGKSDTSLYNIGSYYSHQFIVYEVGHKYLKVLTKACKRWHNMWQATKSEGSSFSLTELLTWCVFALILLK